MRYIIARLTKLRLLVIAVLFAGGVLIPAAAPFLTSTASAAGNLSNTIVIFDRLKASTATNGTVCAKSPSAASATETSVKVTFPTGFTVDPTAADWTVNGTSNATWPSGAVAWTGIAAPTGTGEFVVSGQSVNFTSGNLASNTNLYCFNWVNATPALTTSTAGTNLAGSVITQTTGGVASDTGSYATSIVSNDQIAVTAVVNPSFTFSLSSNGASLGTLTTGGVSATAINALVSTNARAGWQMWAADPGSPAGLTSTTAVHTIGYSPAAGSAAAATTTGPSGEGYNLGAGTASGTTCTGVTTDGNFAGSGIVGGGLDGTLRSLAVSTGVADACALPIKVNASISNTTPAATDYAGLITVVAAGNF